MPIFKTRISYHLQVTDQYDDSTVVLVGEFSVPQAADSAVDAAISALRMVSIACDSRGDVISVRLVSELNQFASNVAAK